jgi:DNA-binding SARP family transcriptional activator
MRLEYRILGPLEVRRGTDVVPVAGGNQRKVLLALVLAPNRSVSREHLIDALWGERLPARAKNALQVHVSGLRDVLEVGVDRGAVLADHPDRLSTERAGRDDRRQALRTARG